MKTNWLYQWHCKLMVFYSFCVRVRDSYVNLSSGIANSKKKDNKNWWFNGASQLCLLKPPPSVSFYLIIKYFFNFCVFPNLISFAEMGFLWNGKIIWYINIYYTTHLYHIILLKIKILCCDCKWTVYTWEFSYVWDEG